VVLREARGKRWYGIDWEFVRNLFIADYPSASLGVVCVRWTRARNRRLAAEFMIKAGGQESDSTAGGTAPRHREQLSFRCRGGRVQCATANGLNIVVLDPAMAGRLGGAEPGGGEFTRSETSSEVAAQFVQHWRRRD